METGQRVHIFFDSTEVVRKGSRELGQICSAALSQAANKVGAQLYLPDLVIDEFVNVRLREFELDYRAAQTKIGPYVEVGATPEEDSLRQTFKLEAETALAKVPATIFKASVTLEDLAALSQQEMIRVSKKKDLGLIDALVFLKSLQYAVTNKLRDCWLVSNDNGFDEDAIKTVGARHGVTFRLARNTGAIVQLMTELAAAQLPSFETDVAKQTLSFVQAGKQVILHYLDVHPLAHGQVVPFILRKPLEDGSAGLQVLNWGPRDTVTVSAKDVRIDAALPVGRINEGFSSSIVIHGRVDVEVLVDRRASMAGQRPSPFYGDFTYGPLGMYHGGVRSVERVEVPVRGQARAMFKKGTFVPPMEVDSISVVADQGAAQ